jgi:CubicO group peptidase (beta-lactamase class C family)
MINLPAATPASQGVDARPLVAMSEWLRANEYDVESLLVVKNDKLIFERYTGGLTRDYNYELYSCTKTLVALLAGILIDKGAISLDTDVASVISKYRPELTDAVADKGDVKLRHILSMSSGFAYDFDPENDPIYFTSPDRLALVADVGSHFAPGTEFEYTDVNPVFATAMLSEAAGKPIQDYAREMVFEPLGMLNATWGREDEHGLVSGGWGLRLRPMDMAKVGIVILHDGEWQGRQLVPASWVQAMETPVAARDFGYYLWRDHIVETEPSYTMMGFKGQFVTVLPDRQTVVVMTGLLPIEGGLRLAKNVRIFRDVVNDYILPATATDADLSQSVAAQIAMKKELAFSAASHPEPGVFLDPPDAPEAPPRGTR